MSESRVLRLDHIFAAWPMAAKLTVLRVSAADFEYFAEHCDEDERRPMFMRAPVECVPELPAGSGVAGFDRGQVRSVRIEWAELKKS